MDRTWETAKMEDDVAANWRSPKAGVQPEARRMPIRRYEETGS
jgi:hypothetical protein